MSQQYMAAGQAKQVMPSIQVSGSSACAPVSVPSLVLTQPRLT